MITFHLRSERNNFVRQIKEEGLYTIIENEIKDETIKGLLSCVFEEAFERLSEEDYEDFVDNLCESISYDVNDIWEVYFDKEEEGDFSNDNYSLFIISENQPTEEEALKVIKENNLLHNGYHLRFIQESDWDDEDINIDDYLYL